MANTIQQANNHGQAIWYDNIRRGMIESGELQALIEQGASGLTANPTICALLTLAKASTKSTKTW